MNMSDTLGRISVFPREEMAQVVYEDQSWVTDEELLSFLILRYPREEITQELLEQERLHQYQFWYYRKESKKRGGVHAIRPMYIHNPRVVEALRDSGLVCDPEILGEGAFFVEIPSRSGKTITLPNGARVRQNGTLLHMEGASESGRWG